MIAEFWFRQHSENFACSECELQLVRWFHGVAPFYLEMDSWHVLNQWLALLNHSTCCK
uniref:Uncharacterized protein n=1 Tax=Triticum urartu TaxID=4572 RepID=A0A8R7V5J5_TRIUA